MNGPVSSGTRSTRRSVVGSPPATLGAAQTSSSSTGALDPSSPYFDLNHHHPQGRNQHELAAPASASPRVRFAPDPTLVALVEHQKQRELAAYRATAAAAAALDSTITEYPEDPIADAEEEQDRSYASTILNMPSNNHKSSKIECVCGRKKCGGVTAIFQVLQDRRGCFVELPPTDIERTLHFLQDDDDDDGDKKQKRLNELDDSDHIPNLVVGGAGAGAAEGGSFMSSKEITWQLRGAYLRHLGVDADSPALVGGPDDDNNDTSNYYVALHHFHPQVVQDSYVVEGDDRLAVVCRSIHESSWKSLYLNLSPDDRIPGTESSYFVVPNYDFTKARDDAQRAFSRFRLQQHGSNVRSGDGDAMFVRTVLVPDSPSLASAGAASRSGDAAAVPVPPPPLSKSSSASTMGGAAPSAVPWGKLVYHPKDTAPGTSAVASLSSASLETASGLVVRRGGGAQEGLGRSGSDRYVGVGVGDVRRASASTAAAASRGRGRSKDPAGNSSRSRGLFGYRGRSQGPTEGGKRGASLTRMFRGRSASAQRPGQEESVPATATKNSIGPARGRSMQPPDAAAPPEVAAAAKPPTRTRSPLRALSPFRRQRSQPPARPAPVVIAKSSAATPKSKNKVIPVNSSSALPSSRRGVSVTRVSQQPRAVSGATRSLASTSSTSPRYNGPVDLDEKLAELNAASKTGDAASKFAKYVPAPLDRKTLRRIRKGLIRQSSDGSLEVDLDDILDAPSDDDESTVATVQRKRAAPKPRTVVVPPAPAPTKDVVDEAPVVVAESTNELAAVQAEGPPVSEEVVADATEESNEDLPSSEPASSGEAADVEFPLGSARQLSPPTLDDDSNVEPASDSDIKDEPALEGEKPNDSAGSPSGEQDELSDDGGVPSPGLKENSEPPEVAAKKEESLEPEDTPEQTVSAAASAQGDESENESIAAMAVVASAAVVIAKAAMSEPNDAEAPVATTPEAPAEVSVPTSTNPFEEASEHSSASYGCNPFDDEEASVQEVDMTDALAAESPTPRPVDPFDTVALAAPRAVAYSPSTNPFDSSTYASAAKTPSPTKNKSLSSPSSDLDATEATVESSDFDSSFEEPAGESPVPSKEPRMNLFALTKVEEEVVKEYRLPEELKPLIELSEMPTDRSESMVVFAAIEAKRRGWATSELRGFKEQWGCYKDLIPAMARETEWVEDLLKTACKSIEAYSSMMRAVAGDTLLDEADRIVTDQKKRTKIAAKRAKEVYNYAPADPSVMQPVIDMLVAAVNQLDESAPALTTEVESMSELSAQVSSSGSDLAKAGDRIMLDMDCMETKIQAAWAHLENVDRDLEGNEDHWLAEASYRNTVREGCTLFKTHYAELMKICERIIALDEDRRSRTKEILLSFLPRRRRVFLRVLEATQPSITALEEGRLGRDEINAELDQVIEHITRQSLSKQKRSRSSILNRSLTTKLDLKVEIDMSPITENKMFDSSHVKELRAVEAKITSKAQWQLSLAVLTHDGFLHIVHCDLPESQLKEFQESKQRAESFLSSKCENRTPDISLPLFDCHSKMSSKKECIEITVDGISPLQKMLKRKVSIRLGTPIETSRWFEAHEAFWSRRGEDSATSPRVSRV